MVSPLRSLAHGVHDRAQIADQPEVEVAVVADVLVIHVHDHDLRLGIEAPAVAHAEIERRAGQQDDVGVVERGLARRHETVGMVARQRAARRAIDVDRHVEMAREPVDGVMRAASARLRAEQRHGALGVREQVRHLLHDLGIADEFRRAAVGAAHAEILRDSALWTPRPCHP